MKDNYVPDYGGEAGNPGKQNFMQGLIDFYGKQVNSGIATYSQYDCMDWTNNDTNSPD